MNCSKCGNCCHKDKLGTVFILVEDVNRWEKQDRYDIIRQLFHSIPNWYMRTNPMAMMGTVNGRCVFLSETNECNIHDTKPKICFEYKCRG